MKKITNVDAAREFVRENVSLETVVAEYGHELQPFSHDNVACPCPFHEETEASFAISISKQVYYCYGCHVKGDIFTFVQEIDGIGHIDAIRRVAQIGAIDLNQFEAEETEKDKQFNRLVRLNEQVAKRALKATKLKAFKKWASGRGLDLAVLAEYGVGYSTKPQDRDDDDFVALNLDRRKMWTKVVVVPIRDASGRVLQFRNRPQVRGPKTPKTIASSKKHPLPFPLVYGYFEARAAIKQQGFVILVEGEVDVWQMVAYGFENTCSVIGTNFTTEILEFFAERGVKDVVLLPDGDIGGRKFARRACMVKHRDINVKIGVLEEGDPDDILMREGAEPITTAIENAKFGIHYLIDELLIKHDPVDITSKLELLEELRSVMDGLNKAEMDLALSMLSEQLGMDKLSIHDFFVSNTDDDKKLHDVRSERIVLARMLSDPEFIGTAITTLSASDFHLHKHGMIFSTISDLYRSGSSVDADSLIVKLDLHGQDSVIKVVESLQGLGRVTTSPVILDALREKSIRRAVRQIAKGMISDVNNVTVTSDEIVRGAMSNISHAVAGSVGHQMRSMDTLVESMMARVHDRVEDPNVIVGHDLGRDWQTLNRTIHGLQSGRYWVLAAPSGVGKTSVAVNMVDIIGVNLNVPTLVITLETDADTFTNRLVAYRSRVDQEAMATGYLKEKDLDLIHTAGSQLAASPVRITNRGGTIEEIQALVRHDVITRGTGFVVLDYIQLVSVSHSANVPRHQELEYISRSLLELANDTDVAILTLAQINREGAKKFTAADHTDIGGAYKITQDADIFVVFTEKSPEEIEEDGVEMGNRYARITKNRRDGRSNVGWHVSADMAIQRVREIPT